MHALGIPVTHAPSPGVWSFVGEETAFWQSIVQYCTISTSNGAFGLVYGHIDDLEMEGRYVGSFATL
jgi:hypothetical protein